METLIGILVKAAQLILSLSLLVFIHELGHFLAARAFGIRCDKFYIFFDAWGKKLWSKKIGDTEYGIGWLPLGGYVKIAGMIDESMDKDQLKNEPEPDEFRSKPAWQRFIVMIGGIVMNVVLGIIIFTGLLKIGEKTYTDPNSFEQGMVAHELGEEIGFKDGDKILTINGDKPVRYQDLYSPALRFGGEVMVDRNGQQVNIVLPDTIFSDKRPMYGFGEKVTFESDYTKGKLSKIDGTEVDNSGIFQKGDQLIAVDGQPISNFQDMRERISSKKDKDISVKIDRSGQIQTVKMELDSIGRMGVNLNAELLEKGVQHNYTMGQATKYAVKEGWDAIAINGKGMLMMAMGKLPVLENLQSPIGIANFFGDTFNWYRFWKLTGLISFILAFMNILPIPALDGGHMMFILFEVILGRPLSDATLERAQMIGMLLLIPLMLIILAKDAITGILNLF